MNFWKNMRVGKKLACIFVIIFLFFGVFLLIFAEQVGNIVRAAQNALDKNLHTINMTAREVDHVVWIQNLENYVHGHTNKDLDIILNPAACAFGKWLKSPEREKLAAVNPTLAKLLANIDIPHNALHSRAYEIRSLIQKKDLEEAHRVYQETLGYSQEVIGKLHDIRVLLENMVEYDRQAFSLMLSEAQNYILLLFMTFVIIGTLAAVFLGQSLTRPLRAIADLAQRVRDGDISARLHMQRKDEMGQIADTLDSMLADLNKKIDEAEARVQEITHKEVLLHCVNQATGVLLLNEKMDFDASVHESLRIVGEAVKVDRAYIWANKMGNDGRLYCDQLYEWTSGVQPIHETILAHDISYDDVIPHWAEAFQRGICINNLVEHMSPQEKIQLEPQGVVSILVVPIELDGKVWGFIGFDDCWQKRVWGKADEDILRTSGMFIAVAIRRNRTNMALRHAKERAEEAAKAKSDFLARMSHEIRTPMNGVLGMANIALQKNVAPEAREYFEKIRTSARDLLDALGNVLDFADAEATSLQLRVAAFSLHERVASILQVFKSKARAKGLCLEYCMSAAVPDMVMGDAERLGQVLINSVDNAVKFTQNGGIIIEIDTVDSMADKATLHFCVQDTGVGMDAAFQQWLFQPFAQADSSVTRTYGGMGLGLAIARELLTLMQGHITVESSPQQGTTVSFTLTLPIVKEESTSPQNTTMLDAIAPSFQGKQVLLAEDNEINQIVATTLLEDFGIVVTLANNGLEAVEAVKTQSFDLVLMDIQMPVMDGLEATRHIRALPQGRLLPIVALTAHALSSDYAQSLAAGMNDHTTKPLDPQYLQNVLRRWLSSHASAQEKSA